MPSLDAGFYHLTSLIPLLGAEDDPKLWRWHGRPSTPAHSLRELLDSFRTVDVPNPGDDAATPDHVARAIPFSRNQRTHFARLVVVEDLAYNGLRQPDTLLALLRSFIPGGEVAKRDRVDHLPRACLLVLIDFDAPDGDGGSARRYLDELWPSMEQEWTLILRHCRGFAQEPPRRQASFVQLILDHEVESTFTFSAYGWAADRARRWQPGTGRYRRSSTVSRLRPLLPLLSWGIVTGVTLLLALALVLRLLFGLIALLVGGLIAPLPWASLLRLDPALASGLPVVLLALGLLTLLVPLLWQRILRQANQPWPAQPGTDLRSVLKALYLQRSLLALIETCQNLPADGDRSLRQTFRQFLRESRPFDLDGPTLRPGQIHSIRHRHQP